jgi:hypothetical protein
LNRGSNPRLPTSTINKKNPRKAGFFIDGGGGGI